MITLKKEDGAADLAGITKLSVGVSWDPSAGTSGGALGWARRKKGVDLDLIAILMQGAEPVRFAGLDSLDPLGNGSVLHSGDEQTGAAVGDDEPVTVTFGDVPGGIDAIIFVATASAHRRDAFLALDYLMDQFKVRAPLWKREDGPDGPRWIAPRDQDHIDLARWAAGPRPP